VTGGPAVLVVLVGDLGIVDRAVVAGGAVVSFGGTGESDGRNEGYR
jgi:hypothetical protein